MDEPLAFRIGPSSRAHVTVSPSHRERPHATDYWDGNWVYATVTVAAGVLRLASLCADQRLHWVPSMCATGYCGIGGAASWSDVARATWQTMVRSQDAGGSVGALVGGCVLLPAWCLLGALFLVHGSVGRTVAAAQSLSHAVAKAAHTLGRRTRAKSGAAAALSNRAIAQAVAPGTSPPLSASTKAAIRAAGHRAPRRRG